LEARGQLPLLVRRLIRRTTSSLTFLDFPAVEQVQRPGFDGTVECTDGNQFVPSGRSGWEMGVGKNPQTKANQDFKSRTDELSADEQKAITFVFVTPRPWLREERDDWIKEKKAVSHWKDILVHDGNDLEHWLEIAPDIDIWFSRLTGRAPAGAQDLGSHWEALQLIADPALLASVFTASREQEAAAVGKWLSEAASSLFMRTSGLFDGIDFLAAMSSENEKLQNAIIICSMEGWRDLASRRESMVLVAAPTLELQASDISGTVNAGHHVFMSGPRGNMASHADQVLRRQNCYSVSDALVASAYPEARAMGFAKAACGSSSILKRLITKHRETVFPSWSRDEVRSRLAPLALIGGWKHVSPEPPPRDPSLPRIGSDPPIDVLLVSELLNCKPEELDELVTRWQVGTEPLLVRFADSVFVASREDAWYLLGGMVSRDQLLRFCEYACLVLEEENPALQLDQEQRWMANLLGKAHTLSHDLRTSIVETLVLMAIHETADVPVANVEFGLAVRGVMERVLPEGVSWQRWASLGSGLMIIAEADPDYFLARVEADLGTPNPSLPGLFQDSSHGIFGGGALHTNLLWALETLAWAPKYLRRVAVCLAKLATRDPGGTYSNRPNASLHEILLSWHWYTSASVSERIEAISAVMEVEEVIGWNLLCSLLPSGRSMVSHPTHMPRWRTWADGWSKDEIRRTAFQYHLAIAALTLQKAGYDPAKWAQVVDGMLRYSNGISEKVLVVLENAQGVDRANADAKCALWETLRHLVARHERYAEADWTFEAPTLARLAAIRDRLEPTDPMLKYQWVFQSQAEIPGIDRVNFQAHDQAVYDLRLAGMQEIIDQHGKGVFYQLLERGYDPGNVGWIAGAIESVSWEDVELPIALESTDQKRLAFVSLFIANRFRRFRWTFVNSLPCSKWKSDQLATLARFFGFVCDAEIWNWVEGFGSETARAYWQTVRVHLHDPIVEDIRRGVTSLMDVGRGFSAIDLLQLAVHCKVALPSDLIAEVLEMGSSTRNTETPDRQNNLQYCVQKLVKLLQNDTAFDRLRLMRIEWGYLSMLDPQYSQTTPDTLVSLIESEPAHFVELLSKVYRAQSEEPDDEPLNEQELSFARHARTLIDRLSRLPGTQSDGSLNITFLRNWTNEVRRLASECDRASICDVVLAELFVRSTRRRDGDWPPLEVATLMEEIGTESFFRSFKTSMVNTRGITTRDPFSGGDLERNEADRCRHLAEYARSASPKLAEGFLAMAKHYEVDAKREDDEAQRLRVGR
jgi:hypothetical protein